MPVSYGKNRALKRFLRNKFRTPQEHKQAADEPKSRAAAKNNAPAYSLSTQIPESYNDTYVRAIPKDPQHAFVYWEFPENKKCAKNDASSAKGNKYAGKHEVIKIQQTPRFQIGQTFNTIQTFQDVNHTHPPSAHAAAQINPQSHIGNTYVETRRCEGGIKAEYGLQSDGQNGDSPKNAFEILASSPTVQNSDPSIKQIYSAKKGVDTNALTAYSLVKLNTSQNISGLEHLSSGTIDPRLRGGDENAPLLHHPHTANASTNTEKRS